MGPLPAIALSIGANVVLFGVIGLVATALSDRMSRLVALYVLVCLAVFFFALWTAGYAVAFVNTVALMVAFVVYALPFVMLSRISRDAQ
jgi:hypothetical protein